ncbi:MAG: segregation/condensation protein A [Deltaproteobacteria bacterium]|nr:segregation/condensation protein A [Deltaproteobacteria bacterium]
MESTPFPNEEGPQEFSGDINSDQPESPWNVRLEVFEGPLDLLLHLIKKNEINIYDIPIAVITEQYLEYLEMMKSLNLDIAGEFLLMAATLLHIKSKMLLPPAEEEQVEEGQEEKEGDPRAELVRRLVEYQRFKEAALDLTQGSLLDRDVFTRTFFEGKLLEGGEEALTGEATLFDLLEALKKVLQGVPPEEFQEVSLDQLNIKEKIHQIMDRLWGRESLTFNELFAAATPRREIILTFLALLELLRLRLIKVYQSEAFGTIRIFSPLEREEGQERMAERIL